MPNVFDKKVYYEKALLWKLTTLFKVRIKAKKIHHILEYNHSQWLKPYVEFNTQKKKRNRKNRS